MNAIQRWKIWCDYGYPDAGKVGAEDRREADVQIADGQWCKAADVAELERVLAEQQQKHAAIVAGLRQQIERLQDELRMAIEDDRGVL